MSAVRCESCIPREAERAQRERKRGGESVYALQVVPCSLAVGRLDWNAMRFLGGEF